MSRLKRYSELEPGYELPSISLTAVNTAAGVGIHDDTEATRYGYRAGLVPGPTIYSYINRILTDYLGAAWLSSGKLSVTFSKPLYHGDKVTIGAAVIARTADVAEIEIWGSNGDGVRCVRGTALFPLTDGDDPPQLLPYVIDPSASNGYDWPHGHLPVGLPFTPVIIEVDPAKSHEYAAKAEDSNPIYTRLVHPAVFISASIRMRVERATRNAASTTIDTNRLRNVGMHVGSEITHFFPARVGQSYRLYGTYTSSFQRNGSDWGTSEVVALDEFGRCVFRTRNTFIFRLAPRR